MATREEKKKKMMNLWKNCWLLAYLLDWRCSNSEFSEEKNKQTEDDDRRTQRSKRRLHELALVRGSRLVIVNGKWWNAIALVHTTLYVGTKTYAIRTAQDFGSKQILVGKGKGSLKRVEANQTIAWPKRQSANGSNLVWTASWTLWNFKREKSLKRERFVRILFETIFYSTD